MTAPPRYPRPPVLDQLPAGQHLVIEASAGTGKTFTIEHLVVDRVLAGQDLSRILVVTFTDRAAAELRARVRGLLWTMLAAAERPPALAPGTPAWTLDADAVARLRAALARIDVAAIATIHAFCQSVLTEHAFAHRSLFTQQLVDGEEVFAEVMRGFLRAESVVEPLFGAMLRPWLGAGSEEDDELGALIKGTYEVVTFQGVVLPDCGATARGMVDGVLAALPTPMPGVDDLVARYRGRLRPGSPNKRALLEQALGTLDRARGLGGVARLLELAPLVTKASGGCEYGQAIADGAGFVALANAFQAVERWVPSPRAMLPVLYRDRLREEFRAHKQARGLFDYDDMLSRVADSLRGPAGAALGDAVRGRFDLVLVDEFQDTDPVQWEVFRTLFVDHHGPCRLAIIGDPKQAIYGFRAADVGTYLGARADLTGETDPAKVEAKLVRLTDNYRSSADMIDAYNLVLEQLPSTVAPIFEADPRIQYGDRARVRCGDPSHRLVDASGAPVAPIRVLRVRNAGSMAEEVAAELARLLAPGAVTLHGKDAPPAGRALRPGDVFVLGRAAADLRKLAAALARVGLPYAYYKLDGLFETDEAGDLVDLLAAIAAPHDRRARHRAWLTPFFELTPAEVEAAGDAPDEHPLVRRLLRWGEHARRRDLRRLLGSIVDDSGLARRAALVPGLEPMVANVQRMLDLLAEEARRRQATLDELVELLRAWRAGWGAPSARDADAQPLATARSSVQLMSMHAAKGLEAPVVVWVGGHGEGRPNLVKVYQDGGRRHGWVGDPPVRIAAQVEAERRGEDERLTYVALTRPRTRMYVPLTLPVSRVPAPRGTHRFLNARLLALAAAGLDPRLFDDAAPAAAPPPPDAAARRAALLAWTPPPPSPVTAPDGDALAALVAQRRGAVVTSYTQLAARSPVRAAVEVERALFTAETNHADTPADQLVTSNEVGSFLHDALEQLDLARCAELADAAAFAGDARVRDVVEPLADGAGIDAAQRPHAYRLLHAAVCRPIPLGDAGVLPRLAGLPRVLRESEFVFPLPEAGHPRLGAPAPAAAAVDRPFAVERGLVKGFIDVVFEHAGRVYFGDWKSSVLRDPSPAGLQRYVAAHFRWQIVVYGIAVLRLLGVRDEADYERRFGGILYLFLREMERTPEGEPARGVWFARPSWEEARGWEDTLRRHDLGGGGAR